MLISDWLRDWRRALIGCSDLRAANESAGMVLIVVMMVVRGEDDGVTSPNDEADSAQSDHLCRL